MMHLARASLVVALLLLASVASASAECAWVLWQEELLVAKDIVPPSWRVVEGAESRNACLARAEVQARGRAEMARQLVRTPEQNVELSGNSVRFFMGGTLFDYRFTCLPDTVDPRAPK